MPTLCSSLLVLLAASEGLAQRPSLDDIARRGFEASKSEVEAPSEAEPQIKSTRFSQFRAPIRALCVRTSLDARQLDLHRGALAVQTNARNCPACVPLARLIATSCENAKAPRSLKEATALSPQREPHPAVLQSAHELAESLTSDVELLPEIALVMARIFEALESADEAVACSPACRDYAQVLKQPFRHLIDRRRAESKGAESAGGGTDPQLSITERRELLDELF